MNLPVDACRVNVAVGAATHAVLVDLLMSVLNVSVLVFDLVSELIGFDERIVLDSESQSEATVSVAVPDTIG